MISYAHTSEQSPFGLPALSLKNKTNRKGRSYNVPSEKNPHLFWLPDGCLTINSGATDVLQSAQAPPGTRQAPRGTRHVERRSRRQHTELRGSP